MTTLSPSEDGPAAARTTAQLIRSASRAYGTDVAIVREVEGEIVESLSFAELEARSSRIARGLIARGIGKGTRVGFIFGNGPMFAVMFLAISRIGAIAVPISTMIRSNELVRVLHQSDVHGLVMHREMLGKDYVERLIDALPSLREAGPDALAIEDAPFLRWVVSEGAGLPASIRPMSWLEDAGDTIADDLLAAVEAQVHPTDQCVEIYTSGSMALPKGVKHAHGPVLFRTHWLQGMTNVTRGKTITCMLPMFWVGGMMLYLMPAIAAGARNLCTDRTLSNSRVAMGSVLADEDLELVRGPKPWWGLGMSETIGPYTYGDDFRAPGRPVCAPMDNIAPGIEIRVADENGNPVGDGEVGEMQVRGYIVASGLHKIERSDYFDADGFFHTGDMCQVEERPEAEGGRRIHFVGRGGDMIKSASSNVSPAEVEMELQALPGVHSAYVLGVPDKERGELVTAVVVPREGATLDFAQIEAELRQRLSSYKVPRAYLEMAREDVPLLHSNKIARRQLQQIMAEHLGRG